MNYLFPFEKLDVWQLSKSLAVNIYKLTGMFPISEIYGLSDQLRRASVSVSSNIAEGNSRKSIPDRQRFFNMSYSSLMEIMSQLSIAFDLGYIELKKLEENRILILEISNKINSLINSQIEHTRKDE